MDGSNTAATNKDLASVLAHVEALQKQLVTKEAELRDSKLKEDEARRQAEQLSNINSKLSEAKREAMKQDFNGKVREWIKDLDSKQVPDTLKDEFLSSCERFAEAGNDTGVWKVLCCASAVHQNQVNTIQKLTEEYNTLKKTIDGGEFRTEESRKRKEMEPTSGPAFSVWEQLEGMCRSY